MIIITSRIPKELKKSKSLSKLIQGYLYSHLPESEYFRAFCVFVYGKLSLI